MKDSKFIELLNLYVDHQISASDAALLETEIQQNPQRRQIYRQYCQMQKACVVLADQFRSEAPASAAKVIPFETPRRTVRPYLFATGLVASAACIALVLAGRSGSSMGNQPTPSIAVAPAVAPVAPAKAALPALQPVFKGIVRDDSAAAAVAVADRPSLDWMTRVQFERVPAETLRFDLPQTSQVDDLTFRPQRLFDVKTEGAAFRFQK